MVGRSSSFAAAMGTQVSSTSSASGPMIPSTRWAIARASAAKKRVSNRLGRRGGGMGRGKKGRPARRRDGAGDEMQLVEAGLNARLGERFPAIGELRRARNSGAEQEPGLLEG